MAIDRPFPRGLSELAPLLLRELHRVEALCEKLGPQDGHQLRVFLEMTGETLRQTERVVDELGRTMYEAQWEALLDVGEGTRDHCLR